MIKYLWYLSVSKIKRLNYHIWDLTYKLSCEKCKGLRRISLVFIIVLFVLWAWAMGWGTESLLWLIPLGYFLHGGIVTFLVFFNEVIYNISNEISTGVWKWEKKATEEGEKVRAKRDKKYSAKYYKKEQERTSKEVARQNKEKEKYDINYFIEKDRKARKKRV